MTTYKEVFQLAQDKGYKRWFEDNYGPYGPHDFLELTLIQKWLRDEHKLHIQISVVPASENFPNGRWGWIIYNMNKIEDLGKGIELYEKHRNCDAIISHEQALLEGIAEALKLLP
jgi:hypothetical protein